MHLDHFALDAEPFSLTPDPEFLYLSPVHAEALAALTVGVRGRRGLLAMTGEVGTGKTTLLYSLMRELGDEMRTAYVANTTVSFEEMLRLVLSDFGAPTEHRDRVDLLLALNALLLRCADEGTTALLIIDEAHNLDPATLENLRLLSNVETFRDKLLQIVLVGQPELDTKLQQPGLRQLAERIAVHCQLAPLGRFESRAYLDYRLLKAGGSSKLFARDARELLLEAAAGIPRRINILCHNAMLFAYGRGEAQVTRAAAEAAIRERAALLPTAVAPPRAAPVSRRFVGAAVAAAAALVAVVGLGWFARERSSAPPAAPVAARVAPVAAPEPAVEQPATVAAVAVDAAPEIVDAPAPAVAAPAAEAAPEAAAPAGEPAAADPPVAAAPAAPAPAPAPAPEAAAAAPPSAFRTVEVPAGATLAELARAVYGAADDDTIRRIQSANPQVVDPNVILAGDRLRFPANGAGEAHHE